MYSKCIFTINDPSAALTCGPYMPESGPTVKAIPVRLCLHTETLQAEAGERQRDGQCHNATMEGL